MSSRSHRIYTILVVISMCSLIVKIALVMSLPDPPKAPPPGKPFPSKEELSAMVAQVIADSKRVIEQAEAEKRSQDWLKLGDPASPSKADANDEASAGPSSTATGRSSERKLIFFTDSAAEPVTDDDGRYRPFELILDPVPADGFPMTLRLPGDRIRIEGNAD